MDTWNEFDARDYLDELLLRALEHRPQRVMYRGETVVFILERDLDGCSDPALRARLGPAGGPEARGTGSDGGTTTASTVVVQPLPREVVAAAENGCAPSANGSHPPDRKWVWEWDEESQCYALPWAKDVDPAAYPGLPFLNAMQNSPLAEALRSGEIVEEEWRALFDRSGG